MKTKAWNLIVIPPSSPRVEQFHFSYKAAAILVAAFVLAFLTTVLLLLLFPTPRISENDRMRLETENKTLKVDNDNLSFRIHRLDAQVKHAEEKSRLMEALADTE
jgi:hypothetical protein